MSAILETILAHNRAQPAPAAPAASGAKLCVIACSSPRLDAQLMGGLGLEPGQAMFVRVPGPAFASPQELARAVAVAVFVERCDEVLVLAHTGCAIVHSRGDALAAALASRGVPRNAIADDLRSLFNLQGSERQLAVDTTGAIRALPFLPADVLVHAVLLDTATGALELVERGAAAKEAATPSPAASGPSRVFADPGPVSWRAAEPATPVTAPPAPALSLQPSAASHGSAPLPTSLAPPPLPPKKKGRRNEPRRGKAPAPSQASASEVPPNLCEPVSRVRAFVLNELTPADREAVRAALHAGYQSGASINDLLNVVLRPVLSTGQKRYKILDELLEVKQAAGSMSRERCVGLLQSLVP